MVALVGRRPFAVLAHALCVLTGFAFALVLGREGLLALVTLPFTLVFAAILGFGKRCSP